MTGRGSIHRTPILTFRWMVSLHVFWLAIICLLGAWWSRLVFSLTEKLAALAPSDTDLVRTHRMLFWETSTFFSLLLASSALLLFLYWRDAKRARSLGAFFASVTHELRTPLTSIRLQAESLASSSQEQSLTKRLLEDTLRLESQVERTLELARVEGGGPLFCQPLRLRSWLKRSLLSWQETYGDRIVIQCEIEDGVVEADTGALQVILRNLLENSVRHSNKRPVNVHIGSSQSRGSFQLHYRDDGATSTSLPKKIGGLFEKGTLSQGAGVGLYLIRALMERMGGRAEFLGGPGFIVQLTFREAHADG